MKKLFLCVAVVMTGVAHARPALPGDASPAPTRAVAVSTAMHALASIAEEAPRPVLLPLPDTAIVNPQESQQEQPRESIDEIVIRFASRVPGIEAALASSLREQKQN